MVHPYYLLILQTLLVISSLGGNKVLATENAPANVSTDSHLRRFKRDMTTEFSTSAYLPSTVTPNASPSSTVTYLPTFEPTRGAVSTKDNSFQAFVLQNQLTAFGKGALMTYHITNMVLTFFVNIRMIYLITTKVKLFKRPSTIPVLAAAVACLCHVFTANMGLVAGLTAGEWIWDFKLCGAVQAAHQNIVYYTINCCALVTIEATYLLLNPLTYDRSSRKTFWYILAATLIAFVVLIPSIHHAFFFIEVGSPISDIKKELYFIYGDVNGEYQIDRIVESGKTFIWLQFWKRCKRYVFKRTWDRRMTLLYPITINMIAFGLVVYSFVQVYKPSRKKNNFQAALAGKGKFTLEDMASNEKLVKSAALTTTITVLPCIVAFLNYAMVDLDYNYARNWTQLVGSQNYYTYTNTTEFLVYLIPWVSTLVSMFFNPDIVRVRKGESDYENIGIDRWFRALMRRLRGNTVSTSDSQSSIESSPRYNEKPGPAAGATSQSWRAKLVGMFGKKTSSAATEGADSEEGDMV